MKENASKTNYKLDCIWRNSNSDCDIFRVFNAFPLNLTSTRESPATHENPLRNPYTHGSPASFIDFCTQQWLILLQWRYDMLCISGFTDDVIFGHISLH